MLNVFIIDQKPFFRLGIKFFLEREFKNLHLTDFANLQESQSALYSKKPDLIFIGIDSEFAESSKLHDIKKLYQNCSLIVCDLHARAETGIKYLRSGAKGYLSKGSDMAMLGICVQTVLDGKFYLESTYLETLIMDLTGSNKLSRKKIHIGNFSLSHKQYEIALLLAQGLTTSEISIKLGIQASTVSSVKSVIYTKLNIDNVIGLKEVLGVNQ